MILPLAAMSVLIWLALVAAAAVPVILLILFIIDVKKRQVW